MADAWRNPPVLFGNRREDPRLHDRPERIDAAELRDHQQRLKAEAAARRRGAAAGEEELAT